MAKVVMNARAERHPWNAARARASQMRMGILRDKNMSRMTTCLGTPSGAATASRPLQIKSARERIAGVPNTLPLHGINKSVELGRVGCFMPNGLRRRQKSPESLAHKTCLYNMLRGAGQTR